MSQVESRISCPLPHIFMIFRASACLLAIVHILSLFGLAQQNLYGQTTYALLVGVGQTDDKAIDDLPFISNDVEQLSQALRVYGNVSNITSMHDGTATQWPTKSNIESALQAVIKQARPEDQIIFFFSGHGAKLPDDDRLYLVPRDADNSRPAETFISASWIRDELKNARASHKVVLLDSCFAGLDKDQVPSAKFDFSMDQLAQQIGVLTIASCSATEKSRVWSQMRQSLFSYWLVQGLRGHADRSQDGTIDADELYQYVHQHVKLSSVVWFGESCVQSPRRFTSQVDGNPVLFQLVPQDLPVVVRNMAEQLAWSVVEHRRNKVAIAAFTSYSNPNGDGEEIFNGQYGALSRTCTADTEQHMLGFLRQQPAAQVQIVDRRVLSRTLNKLNFTTEDFGNLDKLAVISRETGADTIIIGTFKRRRNNLINLQLEALSTTGEKIASVAGSAVASANIMAEMGNSADMTPVLASATANGVVTEEQLINEISRQSTDFHPLRRADFPFRVWVEVDGQKRTLQFCEKRPNECYVSVDKGKHFSIHVENKQSKTVCLRLLVDGFNTLPQQGEAMPLVHLENARPWILDGNRTYDFLGFWRESQTGETDDEYAKFRVVDAGQSIAAIKRYTEQIGLITAAIYEAIPAPEKRQVGIAPGDIVKDRLVVRRGLVPGRLLGVVHLRYYDSSEPSPCR